MTRRADLDDALRSLTVEVKRISDGIRLAVSGQQLIAAIETDPFWQDIGRSTEEQGTIAGILNGWPSPSVMVPDVGEVYFRIKRPESKAGPAPTLRPDHSQHRSFCHAQDRLRQRNLFHPIAH